VLSYRHAFHAGGPADVLKHAVYAFCLAYMTAKPKPLFVMDTHAGAGLYDLSDPMAAKTGEWRQGVGRLEGAVAPPPLVRAYLDLLAAVRADHGADACPGSPEIARRLLGAGDRLRLCELHPADSAALAASGPDGVARTDGFRALVKAMPPKERRGLALIDPSYEMKDDYDRAADSLIAAHRRFATGTFLLWYPVVERARTETMIQRLAASGVPAQYRIELGMRPDGDGDGSKRGMTASGLIAVNPPWTLPDAVDAGLPWLAERLGAAGRSFARWTVPE
jgi:23S rRNA (adenine2030-N6)-methyltransferase